MFELAFPLHKIFGLYSHKDSDCCVLGCDTMQPGWRVPMFRTDVFRFCSGGSVGKKKLTKLTRHLLVKLIVA